MERRPERKPQTFHLLLDIYPTGGIWDKIPVGIRRIIGETYPIHSGLTQKEIGNIVLNSDKVRQILEAFDLDGKSHGFRAVFDQRPPLLTG